MLNLSQPTARLWAETGRIVREDTLVLTDAESESSSLLTCAERGRSLWMEVFGRNIMGCDGANPKDWPPAFMY
jgi:hypothetical protein